MATKQILVGISAATLAAFANGLTTPPGVLSLDVIRVVNQSAYGVERKSFFFLKKKSDRNDY